jgi:hypothetical protein
VLFGLLKICKFFGGVEERGREENDGGKLLGSLLALLGASLPLANIAKYSSGLLSRTFKMP